MSFSNAVTDAFDWISVEVKKSVDEYLPQIDDSSENLKEGCDKLEHSADRHHIEGSRDECSEVITIGQLPSWSTSASPHQNNIFSQISDYHHVRQQDKFLAHDPGNSKEAGLLNSRPCVNPVNLADDDFYGSLREEGVITTCGVSDKIMTPSTESSCGGNDIHSQKVPIEPTDSIEKGERSTRAPTTQQGYNADYTDIHLERDRCNSPNAARNDPDYQWESAGSSGWTRQNGGGGEDCFGANDLVGVGEDHDRTARDERYRRHEVTAAHRDPSRFQVCHKVNNMLHLYEGDICSLDVDAIVLFTNDTYSNRDGPCGEVFRRGGDLFGAKVEALERCRAGDAHIVKASNISPGFVIFTTGPKSNAKYKMAAENSIHACYREALKLLCDSGLRSIAFPVVPHIRRGFLPEDYCHIGMRTVRRWMELVDTKLDSVVFVASNSEERALASELLPLYFPRDTQEEYHNMSSLPPDTLLLNEYGEVEVKERCIRIGARLGEGDEEDECVRGRSALSDSGEMSTQQEVIQPDIDVSFSEIQTETNTERRLTARDSRQDGSNETTYLEYVHRALYMADSEVFSEIAKYRFVYASGRDRAKRNAVVFSAATFPAHIFEWYDLLLYIIKTLDPIVRDKYSLVYLCTNASTANQPSLTLLKELWQIVAERYDHNLDAMYVLHPGILFKTTFAIAWPWVPKHVWDATEYCSSIPKLNKFVDVTQLNLPQYVIEYDQQVNQTSPCLTKKLSDKR